MSDDDKSIPGERVAEGEGLDIRRDDDGKGLTAYMTPFDCTDEDLRDITPEKAWKILRGYIHDMVAAGVIHASGDLKSTQRDTLAVTCEHGHLLYELPLNGLTSVLAVVFPGGADELLTVESLQRAVEANLRQMRTLAQTTLTEKSARAAKAGTAS